MNATPNRPLDRRLDWIALHMLYIVGTALVIVNIGVLTMVVVRVN